jgi:recombination protein RecA
LVQKSGSWYSHGGDRIGQGKDNVKNFLKEHPEVANTLEAGIREKAFAGVVAAKTSKGSSVAVEDDF